MRGSRLVATLLVIQVLVLLNQWLGAPISTARGQIPDAGAQQLQIIDQLKASNDKLDKIIALLQSGHFSVEVVKPDGSAATPDTPAPAAK